VIAAGQQLDIELADGRIPAQALQGGASLQERASLQDKASLQDGTTSPKSVAPTAPAGSKRKPGGGGQGSLF
jgi:hypothetical protein